MLEMPFSGLLPVEMENSFRNTGKTILRKVKTI
jgi:hypothetical protein